MDKQLLKEVVVEQQKSLKNKDTGIKREMLQTIQKYYKLPHTVVIAGIRRAGKSTLLYQIMSDLGKDGYYLNFEDERLLDFTVADFNNLYEIFIELFGEKKIFFFDEIQNAQGWERFVRRMSEQGYKFFITGSNASLLSKELGTKLTGRYFSCDLYPFSFKEYLSFIGYQLNSDDLLQTSKRGEIKKHFNNYFKEGGMPEYLKYKTSESLKKVYNDILYRDIITRYDIKETKSFRELSFYLLSNISSHFSYNNLKKILNLGSPNTVKNYIEYLENSFLFSTTNLYSYSLKKQLVAPKKIYSIDNGLARAVGFNFSQNTGKLLENLISLELKRRGKEVFYYKTKNNLEVDFLASNNSDKQIIQAAWTLNDKKTKDREIKALVEALKELKIKDGLILTADEEKNIKMGQKTIIIKPVYKWLLEQ